MIPSDLFDEDCFTVSRHFPNGNVLNVSKNFFQSDQTFSNILNLKYEMLATMKLMPPLQNYLEIANTREFPKLKTSRMDQYEFVSKIGEGSFGAVGEYLDKRNRFTSVAIKTTPDTERETFIQERNILRQLRSNEYVTNMLDAFEENGKCHIVMQRADRTLGRLIQETGPMDLQTVVHIARQIALGLEGLHSIGWTHTDLKPENIVVYDDMRVQLIDFGCCMRPDEATTTPSGIPTDSDGHYYLTTRWYRAPEVVLATDDVLGHKIDMWALGCILVQMLTGFVLFPASDEEDLIGMMEIFLGPMSPDLMKCGANTQFMYAHRSDMSVRSIPDLKKPNAHHRTRWMKYTKMCWTKPTDAFETFDYIQFARLDQSHIFNGLELSHFQRTVDWSSYLNMLYMQPDHPHATKLRHVIRSTLVYNPHARANAQTIVDMLASPDDA